MFETEEPKGLDERQFRLLAGIARERWGLHLPDKKRGLVSSRAARLMRRVGQRTLDGLIEELSAPNSSIDPLELFDVLSTNHTSFFRDPRHFEALRREVIEPALRGNERKLRIWSAGCSNGCEPYSHAMTLHDTPGSASLSDVRILATDLSVTVLGRARRGVYSHKYVRDLAPDLVARHFQRVGVGVDGAPEYQVRPHVSAPITFGLLNLLEPWKMRGPFDAIFCRNVMIYFDEPTKHALVERFLQLLRNGGLFVVGGSEALTGRTSALECIQPSVYRKVTGARA